MELLSVPDESIFLEKELFPVEGFNIPPTEQFERRDMSWVFGKGCDLPITELKRLQKRLKQT